MLKKEHTIKNSNGEDLRAVLELPENDMPKAYAIFAHCFTCNSDLRAVRAIARGLTNYGFAVMRFDFTGLGESEGEFANTNFTHNIDDLEIVAEYLAENFQAPKLIIGHSLGGAAALVAAAKIDSVEAVVALAAPAEPAHVTHLFADKIEDMERNGHAEVNIGGRPFVLKKQFLDDLESQNNQKIIKELRKPLLIMHSPQDKIVGIHNAAKIYERAHHPKSFISLDGADHLLSDRSDSAYVADIIGIWVQRYLVE